MAFLFILGVALPQYCGRALAAAVFSGRLSPPIGIRICGFLRTGLPVFSGAQYHFHCAVDLFQLSVFINFNMCHFVEYKYYR